MELSLLIINNYPIIPNYASYLIEFKILKTYIETYFINISIFFYKKLDKSLWLYINY